MIREAGNKGRLSSVSREERGEWHRCSSQAEKQIAGSTLTSVLAVVFLHNEGTRLQFHLLCLIVFCMHCFIVVNKGLKAWH